MLKRSGGQKAWPNEYFRKLKTLKGELGGLERNKVIRLDIYLIYMLVRRYSFSVSVP
jgi:hypothetical protein